MSGDVAGGITAFTFQRFFRNIEELQEQNQSLLQVVRELSEKNEEEEKKTIEEK